MIYVKKKKPKYTFTDDQSEPPINPEKDVEHGQSTAYIELAERPVHHPSKKEFSLRNVDQLTDVNILEKLGAGNFGEVYKGEWNGAEVALKKLKSQEDFEEFAKEAMVLK